MSPESYEQHKQLDRRDALCEAAITTATELKAFLEGQDLMAVIRAIELLKSARRPVVAEFLEERRLQRAIAA